MEEKHLLACKRLRIPRKSNGHSPVKRTLIPLQGEQRFRAIANKQDAAIRGFCLFTRTATSRSTDFASYPSAQPVLIVRMHDAKVWPSYWRE